MAGRDEVTWVDIPLDMVAGSAKRFADAENEWLLHLTTQTLSKRDEMAVELARNFLVYAGWCVDEKTGKWVLIDDYRNE